MRQLFLFLLLFVATGPLVMAAPLPRIAIAGLAIESSTFSPALTDEAAFHAKRGADIFSMYPFFAADSSLRRRAVWIPTLVGRSLPGGAVTREAYESLVNQTLDSLRKNGPYDGLFFDIHGAMSVVGLQDPEGDFITRIRAVIGKTTIISTSMDLHGNVSWRLAENTDLITCYRMAPHEDAMDTKQRAVENLLDRLVSGKGKPAYKAWISIPILLPGEKTSTRIEPAKSVYAAVAPAAAQKGIIDAAIWVGYAWADEPRNHAVVMVTGDDQVKVMQTAEQLAHRFWEARTGYAFVAPTGTLKESLDKALASKKRPFFISDSGDNPTAGGAGDVTWTLKEILARPEFKQATGPSLIYASIPGPELVAKAIAAGVGGQVDGLAGAKVDARYAPPVRLKGRVEAIERGDKDAEVEVVVLVGSVHVIVTQKRKPYHKEIDFTRLGLHPRQSDIVVVKIGYLEPELYAMRADWILALTPGGVDQNLERLPYKHIQRPMFPLDKDMPIPDLSARMVPASDTQPTIPLYPDSIPNSRPGPDEEKSGFDNNGVAIISKISRPSLTLFPVAKDRATGAAVIICPGGGYWVEAINLEGSEIARRFNEMGVSAIVLKYRIPSDATMVDREIGALQDAQQAIKTVRDRAKEWNIDPSRIGIMGFSAGGHLAAAAGTHFAKALIPNKENTSLRPDFMLLIYPVITCQPLFGHSGSCSQLIGPNPSPDKIKETSNELLVTDATPPAFLVHASDDGAVSPQNSIAFYQALLEHHIPAELHLYQRSGHGFGLHLKGTQEEWMDRCRNWMEGNGWFKK